jgi:hypothetical protein
MSDRFSRCTAAQAFLLVQHFSRCERAQRKLKTSAMGSFETFAASRLNVGNGVKGRLCADVLVIPIM